MLLPPGRFSTKTLWPKLSCIFCATSRATMSVPPPAAKPTMILIARAGYVVAAFWADAGDTASKPRQSSRQASSAPWPPCDRQIHHHADSIAMQNPCQRRADIAAAAQPAGSGRHARVESAARVHSFARAPHLPRVRRAMTTELKGIEIINSNANPVPAASPTGRGFRKRHLQGCKEHERQRQCEPRKA